MNILCPLNSSEEVKPLVEAGADIFYAGLNSKDMLPVKIAEKGMLANCRFYDSQNFSSKEDLAKAVKEIHSLGKQIYLAINANIYSEEQIAPILDFVESAKEMDAFIVSDINLILELKKRFENIKIIASTSAHIFNSNAVGFFRNLGVSGMVIPQHMTLDEIRVLASSNSDIEFEAFIKNGGCNFNQGLCFYSHDLHMPEGIYSACCSFSKARFSKLSAKKDEKILEMFGNPKIKAALCGACAIQKLKDAGIKNLKIVGRGLPLDTKIGDVKFIKYALENSGLSEEKFIGKVKGKNQEMGMNDCSLDCTY